MLKFPFIVFLSVAVGPAYAGLCTQWDAGKEIGSLPSKDVREVSGMALSKTYANRVYWINDSGDKGFFFYSDLDGKNMRKVKVANYRPRDSEAIALVDCEDGPCLALGDIGDNLSKREHVKITFVPEQKEYAEPAKVLRTLTLKYPDGARDAESLAFLPSGELLIVSKELRLKSLSAESAGVYALSKSEWSGRTDKNLELKKLGDLPLPKWLTDDLFFAQAATDIAVNSQRQVLGILTYEKAVEIPLKSLADIANSANWKKDRDYAVVEIHALAQQESLGYLASPDRMIWSTEYRKPAAPIFSMTCTLPAP